MDGREMIKKLLIICTLVAQNLSFATELPAKETHIEYKAERFVGTSYELLVIDSYPIDFSWDVELVRVQPVKPKERLGRTVKWVGDFASSVFGAEEKIRTYYMVRVRCFKAVCEEYNPKSVNVSFEYFESGTPRKKKLLKNVDLGIYAYFYESSTTLALELLTPTLHDIRVQVNDVSDSAQFPSLAITK